MHGDEPGTDLDTVNGEPAWQQGQQGVGDQERYKLRGGWFPLCEHPSSSPHQAPPSLRKGRYLFTRHLQQIEYQRLHQSRTPLSCLHAPEQHEPRSRSRRLLPCQPIEQRRQLRAGRLVKAELDAGPVLSPAGDPPPNPGQAVNRHHDRRSRPARTARRRAMRRPAQCRAPGTRRQAWAPTVRVDRSELATAHGSGARRRSGSPPGRPRPRPGAPRLGATGPATPTAPGRPPPR